MLFLKLLFLLISATQMLLAQSIDTLTIDWSDGPLATDLGVVNVDTNVVIVWSIFGNPNNLSLSVLLEFDPFTGGPTFVRVLAAGDVPNNGSFLWRVDVDDVLINGGGYYIRLQTGTSSDWDDGTGTSPPTPDGVYGLAGFFTINSASTTSLASSTSVLPDITTSTSLRVTGAVTASTTTLPLTRSATTTSSQRPLPITRSTTTSSQRPLSITRSTTTTSSRRSTTTPRPVTTSNTRQTTAPRPVSTRATSRSPNPTTIASSSPATIAPASSPSASSPPANSSPALSSPAVTPPVISPPAVSPPAVSPPAVSPPTISPPAISPPATSPQTTTLASTSSTQSQPSSTTTSVAGGNQIILTLPIDWSDANLNSTLGSIITGTNINIVWDPSRNSDNTSLSVLLKQGSGSEGGQVVSVIAPEKVQNTGSFVWSVSTSLPPGDNYYIRVQTGTSDDWNGGLNTSPSTPGAFYGVVGYFSINSTTGTSGAFASTIVTATHFVTCCTGGGTSPGEAGAIAGSVIGGLLFLFFLAWWTWRHRRPKPPRPGMNPSENRTFSFDLAAGVLDRLNDERLGPAQLTLILKPQDENLTVQPIAWQVFNLDGREPFFAATLPPDRGFGNPHIEDDHDVIGRVSHVKSEQHTFVSPGWQVAIHYEDEALCLLEQSNPSKERPHHIAMINKSEVSHTVIIGSYHVADGVESLQPFGLVEVEPKEKVVAPHALRLQVYLTRGVRVGQVMSDSLLGIPLLRPVVGLKVKDLKPGSITRWTVEENNGVVSLRINT